MKKNATLALLLILNACLFAQDPDQVIKFRINSKITCQEIYTNNKLQRIDTVITFFDRHGNDSIQKSPGKASYITLYTYDSDGKPMKKIGFLDGGSRLDSCIYTYYDNGNYKQDCFYYDSKFPMITIKYNQNNKRTAILNALGKPLDEYFYDSSGRKVKTIIHRENGKTITKTEDQTVDKYGRLLTDNKQAYGGSYDIYQYDERGLLTHLTIYLDKKQTRKWIYKTSYSYY
jgi:hypothetical protein